MVTWSSRIADVTVAGLLAGPVKLSLHTGDPVPAEAEVVRFDEPFTVDAGATIVAAHTETVVLA